MANDTQQPSRQEKFETWNPYAARSEIATDANQRTNLAILATAYEIAQLRTEIHFAAKGRRSS